MAANNSQYQLVGQSVAYKITDFHAAKKLADLTTSHSMISRHNTNEIQLHSAMLKQ